MPTYDRTRNQWIARRREDGRHVYLGRYATEEAARQAEGGETLAPAATVAGGWKLAEQSERDYRGFVRVLELLRSEEEHPKVETGHTPNGHPFAEVTLSDMGRVRLTLEKL